MGADLSVTGKPLIDPPIHQDAVPGVNILPLHASQQEICEQQDGRGFALISTGDPDFAGAVDVDIDGQSDLVYAQLTDLFETVNDAGGRVAGDLDMVDGYYTSTLKPYETGLQGYWEINHDTGTRLDRRPRRTIEQERQEAAERTVQDDDQPQLNQAITELTSRLDALRTLARRGGIPSATVYEITQEVVEGLDRMTRRVARAQGSEPAVPPPS